MDEDFCIDKCKISLQLMDPFASRCSIVLCVVRRGVEIPDACWAQLIIALALSPM